MKFTHFLVAFATGASSTLAFAPAVKSATATVNRAQEVTLRKSFPLFMADDEVSCCKVWWGCIESGMSDPSEVFT